MRIALAAGLGLVLCLGCPPARSAPEDGGQAEISLWQAVIARGQKSDYDGYLLLFPNGRFAPLARLRGSQGSTESAPSPVAPVAPTPDVTLYFLDVTPPVAASGQPVVVRTRGMLPSALYDLIVVVRAGTPDPSPLGTVDESGFVVKGLAHLYETERAGVTVPALPAGAYEVRYLSRQYNAAGRMEVVARSSLTYR